MPGPGKPVYNPHGLNKPVPGHPAKQVPLAASNGSVSTLTGTTPVTTPVGTVGHIDVKQLQSFLRSQGYHLNADGKLGPVTKSALADFLNPHNVGGALGQALSGTHITGNRNPTAWNKQFGIDKLAPNRPDTGKGGSLDGSGNNVTNTYAPPGQDVNLDPAAKAMSAATGKMIPLSLANFGTMIDPKTADAVAGAQFDPQIHDTQLALAQDPLDAAQHGADIKSWYGQALDALKTAASRNTTAGSDAKASISDAAAKIVGSLGGSANMGAGDVAAAGDNAANTISAMNSAESQYQNDLAPLMQNERATQLSGQSNKDAAAQKADSIALENLQGARGQAAQAALAQIEGQNNSLDQARVGMGLDIRKTNNGLAQQNYTNALALAQSQIAALMSGLKVQGMEATIAHKTSPNAFLTASPMDRRSAYNEALSALLDPSTHQPLKLTPQQAQSRVASVYNGFGWSPTPGTGVPAAIQNVISAWGQMGSGQ